MPSSRDPAGTIRPELLRPAAEEVEGTYVKPARVDDGAANFDNLAKGLRGFSDGLDSFFSEVSRQRDEDDKATAQADFHKNNATGYGDAVRQGLIPAFASRAYVDAYKGAQGAEQGYTVEADFRAAYDKFPKDGSLDDFKSFAQGFLQSKLAGVTDPAVLRTIVPRINALTEQGINQFVADKDKATKKAAEDEASAQMDNTVDETRRTSLTAGRSVDFAALSAELLRQRGEWLLAGMSVDKANQLTVDLASRKAIEFREPRFLTILDQPVPGQTYAFRDTPYGADVRTKTLGHLETLWRKGLTEDRRVQKEADEKALSDVNRRVEDAIFANPAGAVPEVLITQGQKFDGNFRTKAEALRKTILEGRGREDPEAVTQLFDRIYRGEGMSAVVQARDAGVILTQETLTRARNEVEKVGKFGADVEHILSSASAKSLLDTIRTRTAQGLDLTNPFAVDGLSDDGLKANYDFRRALYDWRARNPEASFIEQERALNQIGAAILGNVRPKDPGTEPGVTGQVYVRPPPSRDDPFNAFPRRGGAEPPYPLPAPANAPPSPKSSSPTNLPGGRLSGPRQ